MLENKDNSTPLSSIGEFGLIRLINENIKLQNKSSVRGIGDDAAVIDNKDLKTLLSTDMLVEGIHFDLSYVPLKHLGFKSVMVNLSDIYAMNGKPSQILVSIALSSRFTLEAVEELYAGMLIACEQHGIDIVGGDTTSSLSGLIISITAVGTAKEEDIVYRDGARENDLICVSGDLGAAYTGLQLLEREKKIFMENPGVQPDLEGKDYILEKQLKPEARKDIIELLRSKGVVPTSMIDISDGLASEMLHICKQSDKGCAVYENKLPIDPLTIEHAGSLGLNPIVCALNGGEDYELLFTIDLKDYEKIKDEKLVSVIGHITDKSAGALFITEDGESQPITAQGWDHFK